MKYSNLKNIAELVGIVAIVLSLIFVGAQLRQDQKLVEAQIFAESDAAAIDLSQLISDHAALWKRGLGGEELAEHEEVIFQAIAVAVHRRQSGIYERALRLDTRVPEQVVENYAHYIYIYPGYRRFYEERSRFGKERDKALSRDAVQPPFDGKVKNVFPRLDREMPPVPALKGYTFG